MKNGPLSRRLTPTGLALQGKRDDAGTQAIRTSRLRYTSSATTSEPAQQHPTESTDVNSWPDTRPPSP